MRMIDREGFTRWVHEVLNRLYDSPYLQAHPLGDALRQKDNGLPAQRSLALRRTLLDTIAALRPRPGAPAQSPDWRMVRILELRYIEGLSPNEVMEQLAVSKSQFFRDQAAAVDQVAALLWEQRRLPPEIPAEPPPSPDPAELSSEQALAAETRRLLEAAVWEFIRPAEILAELKPMIDRLAGARGARVETGDLSGLPPLRADRVMLRQALLSMAILALANSTGDWLRLDLLQEPGALGLQVRFTPAAEVAAEVNLRICAHMTAALGGECRFEREEKTARLQLRWPQQPSRCLLVVDDNPGLIDLYTRYLAGLGWQVAGASSAAEARRRLAESLPHALLLDIMLPGEDGWELLASLQENPATRHLPVIICSVVSEPQLALSLGAAGSLAKPVSQQELVAALAGLEIP